MSVESDGKDANCICNMCRKVIATYSTVMKEYGGGDAGFRAMQFFFSGTCNRADYCSDCMKIIKSTGEPLLTIRPGPQKGSP